MSKPKIKPPSHLMPATRRWWAQVVADFDLESHHLRLLTLAAEAFDRGTEARETLRSAGTYYRNASGEPRLHPAAGVERDSRIAFARMVREMGLDGAPEPDPRPPGIGGR